MYFINGYYQLFRLLENNSNTAREKGSQRELKLRYSKIFFLVSGVNDTCRFHVILSSLNKVEGYRI